MDMASIDDLQEEKKKKGAKGVTARWQRRMKLTPCVVMTCYMLPGNMQISEHNYLNVTLDNCVRKSVFSHATRM